MEGVSNNSPLSALSIIGRLGLLRAQFGTLLIMDESSGRVMARNLNIRIIGTLGVLLKAKRDGEIPSLKSEMDRLVQDAGFLSRTVSETRSSPRRGRDHENSRLDPSLHDP